MQKLSMVPVKDPHPAQACQLLTQMGRRERERGSFAAIFSLSSFGGCSSEEGASSALAVDEWVRIWYTYYN